jgi:acetyl esterase/lipase
VALEGNDERSHDGSSPGGSGHPCRAGSGPTAAPTDAATLPPTASPTAEPSAAATLPPPTATPAAITAATDLRYESSGPLGKPADLDVYAPVAPGPWPVVVMYHGDPAAVDKGYLGPWALEVAAEGFVVFAPTWGKSSAAADAALDRHDRLLASARQAACAVEFARAHAAEYGGDASRMILFGHSAGANVAAQVAFARRPPTDGCPGGAQLGSISSLVTFEGDWVLMDPMWDAVVPADPAVLAAVTPWDFLAKQEDLPVAMLVSENPGLDRPLGDPKAADWWLASRDPTGTLRKGLEAIGALAGPTIGVADEQTLLYTVLKAQGNPVSLTVMPGASHMSIGMSGRPAFLAAFREAAAAAE